MLGQHHPVPHNLVNRPTDRRILLRRLTSYAIALLLHMLALYELAPRFLKTTAQPLDKTKPVRYLTLKPINAPHIQPPQSTPKALKQPEAVEVPKTPSPPIKGQVVDMSPTQDTTVDPKTPYLAEQNSHVERQTRSKKSLAGPLPAKPIPKATQQKNTTPKAQKTAVKTPVLAPQPMPQVAQPPAQITGIGKAAVAPALTPISPPAAEVSHVPRKLTMIDLVPSMGFLAHLSEPNPQPQAGGGSHDYLEDIPEGEGTFLNTREFKYAAFFNRLKHSVSQVWQPLTEYQRRDPTGQLYGHKSRITSVTVTLDALGNLLNVTLQESSGLDFLDQAAISAFYKAQPFTHPPRDLVDSQGCIRFPFQFYINFN